MTNCPVCHSEHLTELLRLERWPLFQHPVPDPDAIEPVFCDLHFSFCVECGHAFQGADHRALLEQVYRSHYYTPASGNLGASFRQEFLSFVQDSVPEFYRGRQLEVLEIGSSFGTMLKDLRKASPEHSYKGFEPNAENAKYARQYGIDTVNEFFTASSARTHGVTYDLIFSRHVIEHVFDLECFLNAVAAASREETVMLVETPALDRYLELASIDPFHVEHVHVFSLSSLATLCGKHGWRMTKFRYTPVGNVIVRFDRAGSAGLHLEPPKPEVAARIQDRLNRWRAAIKTLSRDRDVIVWGAGSFGLSVPCLLNITPAVYIDGNANKEGLGYVGIDVPIRHAHPFLKMIMRTGEEERYLLVVASAYFSEIRQELNAMGWRGTVLALSEVA